MLRPLKDIFITENQLIRLFLFYYLDFHVPSEYLTNIHIRDKVSVVYYSTQHEFISTQALFFSSDSIIF